MPRQPTTHAYNIGRLNFVFLLASLLLLVTLLALMVNDYDREWKHTQRTYNKLDEQKTLAALEAEEAKISESEAARVEEALLEAQENLDAAQGDYNAAVAALDELQGANYALDQELKFLKAEVVVYKYDCEVDPKGNAAACEENDRLKADIATKSVEYEEFLKDYSAREAAVAAFTVDVEAAQKAYDKLFSDVSRLDGRLARFNDASIANKVRDAPMLDFMDPRVRIKEVLLPELFEDVNMGLTVKRDRCMTCHAGVDKASWEKVWKVDSADRLILADAEGEEYVVLSVNSDGSRTLAEAEDDGHGRITAGRIVSVDEATLGRVEIPAPQPFAAHPRLDEFVGSGSPHPVDTFGCTVCHSGRGYGTTFLRAAHWPSDQETEDRWHHDLHWHELHHWDFDQLPKQYIESSCFQCHTGQTEIPGADKWNRGVQLMELNGCFGCHKVKGYEDVRKAGPSLEKISSKMTPEFVFTWVRDPKGYRPLTRMPQIFDLENIDSPHDRELSTAGINAIVAYLFDQGEEWEEVAPLPVEGDVARGEQIVNNVGCLGCHQVGIDKDTNTDLLAPRNRGPNLANLGSKVNAEWLFAWLKEPHAYFSETRMPNLRLSDQEAADATVYLLSQRDSEWDQRMASVPETPPEARQELMMEYLRRNLTKESAEAKLASMSVEEQDLFLGEKLIARNGCFGCHDIKGFEDAQRIGAELTEEGSKDVLKFDFGLMPFHPDGGHEKHAYTGNYSDPDHITFVPKTRHDWILTKILRPRIWDQGKEKLFDEKLKMPWFDFSVEDAEAITTTVLSFQKSLVPESKKFQMTAERQAIEQGRAKVWQYNCIACHTVEDEGRAISETIEDEEMWPPVLTGQGEKVQSDWFFEFLKKPVPIRPWLEVRMPTFGFDDHTSNAIVEYFARLDEEPFPSVYYDADAPTAEELRIGKEMFAMLQCQQCHVSGGIPEGVDAGSLAPDLAMTHERLKPEWVIKWILDPSAIIEGTKMPQFWDPEEDESDFDDWFDADRDRQIRALRDHLFVGLAKESGAAAE